MDHKKDNFIKDINPSQGHVKTSFENMDKSLIQSAKRAGNIVSALYIVSNILPSDEPLQKEIRKASLSLLSLTNDVTIGRGDSYDRKSNEIGTVIRKIIAYLEVGVTLFLVSEMNFRVLRLELMALGGSYESRRGGLIDLESILKGEIEEKPLKTMEISKGHIKDIINKSPEPIAINVLNKQLSPSFGQNINLKDKSTATSDRKILIIKALQNKPSETITDIKTKFPDVSFKTIQRDLQTLIDEGKIERIGERRWSVYRLKDIGN